MTDVLLEDRHLFDSVSATCVADAAVWVHGDLLPGLLNMHTHLSLSLSEEAGDRVEAMSPHRLALYMASGAERTLRAGVTTIRCIAEKDGADYALRSAIDAGEVRGPRIYTAGRALTADTRSGSDRAGRAAVATATRTSARGLCCWR